MEQTENLRNTLESKKREHEHGRKVALTMLLMVGANILTPAVLADPVIDEANQGNDAKDAFTDMIITMERLDYRKRKALVKAMAVKYLEQRELMELCSELNDLNTDVLLYCHDHEEARKPKEESMQEFFDFLGGETGYMPCF